MLGLRSRRTYTIIGDAVNLSARVMARAAKYEILVTPKVLEHSATTFETETVEPFHVKGKTDPIEAEALGVITGVKHRGLRRLPLTGREAEVKMLRDGLQSAHTGQGTIVEISGIAGVGKSRLLEELRDASSDFTALNSNCERYEASTPYFPFRDLLRQASGIDANDDHQAAGVQLRDLVERRAPSLLPWIPLLAVPLDAEVPETPETTALSSKFRRQRTHEAVRDFMRTILPAPTVATIEDVQWMDDASTALLQEIIESISETPWLICVTRQPEAGGYQRENRRTPATPSTCSPLTPRRHTVWPWQPPRTPPCCSTASCRSSSNPAAILSSCWNCWTTPREPKTCPTVSKPWCRPA